jgi:hypothetical protein
MKSDNNNKERPDSPTHLPEAVNPTVSEMLTPSEIEQLRQEKKQHNAYFKEAFSRLRPR